MQACNIDDFVNCNTANVCNIDQRSFEDQVTHSSVDSEGYPVLVYVQEGMVAWYDIELARGYIS